MPMINQTIRNGVGALILATGAVFVAASPVQAATMQDCSARYQAAQTAGTLNGMTWNDFREAECDADSLRQRLRLRRLLPPMQWARLLRPPSPPMPGVAPGDAMFPPVVALKYATETPARARMHTCRDQYNVNKPTRSDRRLALDPDRRRLLQPVQRPAEELIGLMRHAGRSSACRNKQYFFVEFRN